jgi:glyoxylase-like metal-dependent hydrolase (beta-lactamase superfamily II)
MRLIDVVHVGRPRVIGVWQVGDVLVDPGPTSCLPTLLDALGGSRPRALLLTHIHLDHAGASGSLVQMWPDLEVYVHERGARHLAAPERLMDSARRLYGDDMDRLWGEMVPVPESNLRVLEGGESILGGSFKVAYTPGHASHHVSYLHDGTAFVGDTGGVRITDTGPTLPPTPPPDVDLEAWQRSIELIAGWQPQQLVMTHFGSSSDVDAQLDELGRRMGAWAELARGTDEQTFIAKITGDTADRVDPEFVPAYIQAAPPEQMYAGLRRYWRKREESTASRDAKVS